MSHPYNPDPVKLFAGIIYKDKEKFEKCICLLKEKFTNIQKISPLFEFDQTSYYEKEMGASLKRSFIIFEGLFDNLKVIDLKYLSYEIEQSFSKEEKRSINIDPGYITLHNLVLSTFKGFAHRVLLGNRVWVETTLIYRHNSFDTLEWTYPDYKYKKTIDFFKEVRNDYYIELKKNKS
ncbi:MAG: DUF4416 family protein [Pseudomonadota bacterium]